MTHQEKRQSPGSYDRPRNHIYHARRSFDNRDYETERLERFPRDTESEQGMRNSCGKCEKRTGNQDEAKSCLKIELSRTRKEETHIIIFTKPFMLHTLQTLEQNSLVQISALTSEVALIDLRNAILGKNGSLTELLK